MINRSKQNWTVGSQVKVGFMTLTVLALTGNTYILSANGHLYEFEPHRGLYRCDQ